MQKSLLAYKIPQLRASHCRSTRMLPIPSHTYVNIGREQIDFHHNKKDDCVANDNFHAIITDNSESEGDKREAQSYNGQPERASIPFST